jgi:hypothetical protein
LGRTPATLCSVLTMVRRWPGGRASEQRHALFIGLGQPKKTQPAGLKRALPLPALRGMTFSTAHDRLLVPKAWEGHGACRAGAERREILRHSWDVAVYVEYWSRTLTAGSQLCKGCSDASLRGTLGSIPEQLLFHHAGTEEFPDQIEESTILDTPSQYFEEHAVVDRVEGLDNLLPLSTTHSMTPWRS